MNALIDHEAKQSGPNVATAINPITSCQEPLQHLVATRVAVRSWPRRATAMRTVLRCTVTTAARGVVSTRSVASTSQPHGGQCAQPSCVSTRCVRAVRRRATLSRRWSRITCSRSRTAAPGLTGPTCRPCAWPATTARPRARRPDAADAYDGGGGSNLWRREPTMRARGRIFARAN